MRYCQLRFNEFKADNEVMCELGQQGEANR